MPASILISAPAILTPSETSAPRLLHDSAILIQDGKIAAIGPLSELRLSHPAVPHTHLASCFLTPGLVNAHCHLELSYMRNLIPAPPDFGEWIISLLRAYPPAERLDQVIRQAVHEGVVESLRCGVTTIGDISRQCALSREVLQDTALRVVSFGEVTGLGWGRWQFDRLLAAAAAPSEKWQMGEGKSVGLSPHAPYTIEGPYLQRVVDLASRQSLPICMHLAELAEEGQFLSTLTGPLRKPYEWLAGKRSAGQAFDPAVPTFPGGPIRWAQHFGLLAANVPVILAHGNYLSDEELDILGESARQRSAPLSVAYCPRTRSSFGHDQVAGPHRLLELLARGINVCLGTDSLASNPDLSLLREAQHLHRLRLEIPLELLFEMITLRGARALGLGHVTGALTPGRSADILVFAVPPSPPTAQSLLTALIENAPAPQAIFVHGQLL